MKFLAALSLIFAASVHAASPNDTVIVAPSSATITDASGNIWGINATTPCTATWAQKGQVSEVSKNGALDATSCEVAEIAYVNSVVWQENTGGAWYSWSGTAWVAGSNPLPVTPVYPPSATLTWTAPTTYTTGAPITVPLTYNVYRGTTATTLTKLTSVTGLTYTDPAGSSTPVTYYYAITAVAAGVESADSNEVSATIAAPTLTPSAPTVTVH